MWDIFYPEYDLVLSEKLIISYFVWALPTQKFHIDLFITLEVYQNESQSN